MYDHLIYNPEMLRVTSILEIPIESQLAPSGCCKDPSKCCNHVTYLPNVVYPSTHLRIEAVMQFHYRPEPKES
jgi:hypothetical protein